MSLTPEQFEKEHLKDLEAYHRAVAYELSEAIIDNAPVDEGNLRGSVNVSTSPSDVIKDNPDPSGSSSKQRIKSNLNSAKLDDDLYGTVGEDYAPYVDGGTSEQAPTGFFTAQVSNISNIAKRAVKRIREFRDGS